MFYTHIWHSHCEAILRLYLSTIPWICFASAAILVIIIIAGEYASVQTGRHRAASLQKREAGLVDSGRMLPADQVLYPPISIGDLLAQH